MWIAIIAGAARADDLWEHEARFDFVTGFVGGQRAPASAPFAQMEGPAAASAVDPFLAGVPVQATVFGPTWEGVVVVRGARFDLGVQPLWPDWPDDAAAGDVHGLRALEVVFGLGFEPPIGPVTPYVDVLGRATRWTADVPVGDDETAWSSDGFDPAVRLGLRGVVDEYLLVDLGGSLSPLDSAVWDVSRRAGFSFH